MFGHGSPNFQQPSCRVYDCLAWLSTRQRSTLRLALCSLVLSFALGHCEPVLSQDAKFHRDTKSTNTRLGDVRLRFAWGGGVPQSWSGKIRIFEGKFNNHRPLAITSDSPSTVTARNGSQNEQLVINHQVPTSYGGVDVSVSFNAETKIEVALEDEAGNRFQEQWSVEELVDGTNETIDRQQNRISISRMPGDVLLINPGRSHLVFAPGESWTLSTALNHYPETNQECDLVFRWGSENTINTPTILRNHCVTDETGTSRWNETLLTVPIEEGVHDLSVEIEMTPRTPFGQFRRSRKLLRKIQVVVVAPTRPSIVQPEWTEIQSYTAQELKGDIRSSWPLSRISRTSSPAHGGDVDLAPTANSTNTTALKMGLNAWLAIPIQKPISGEESKPIRVRIQYHPKPGTKLGMNYLTPDQAVLHGMDSGVYVPVAAFDDDQSEEWLIHEFTLWPADDKGYVLISNIGEHEAYLGNISIESGPDRLEKNSHADTPKNGRKRMAMLESLDFSGLFQSQRKLDPTTGQPLDDWHTFYDAVDRLTQHLKTNQYDGAFVTVLSDGSAIFPTDGIAPGPRFDSGIFSSEAQDPMQKDVVELMLRLFERENLVLVPVLTLNSTLPDLERMRTSSLATFDLVDSAGTPVPFGKQRLPFYDPLDKSVQDSCSRLVDHVAQRYGSHASFGGLAMSLRPDCYSMLPGSKYGFQAGTINRFLRDCQIDLQGFDVKLLVENVEGSSIRDTWLAWRKTQITSWYRKMASTVRLNSQRNLFLLPIDIFQNSELESALSPSLHSSSSLASLMEHMALDLDDETHASGVVILSPNRIEPGGLLRNQRVSINLDSSSIAERFNGANSGGSLFIHRGSWRPIDVGDSLAGIERVTRNQLLSVGGPDRRRNYIRSIRKYDSPLIVDGGQSLPPGNTAALDSLCRIFRQLPAVQFDDIGDAGVGPVCMRQYTDGNRHWFYAVNDSPWPVEVIATLSGRTPKAMQASATRLNRTIPITTLDGETVNLEQGTNGIKIRIFIEPWSIYAGTSEAPTGQGSFSIDQFDVRLPEQLEPQLRKRIYQLKSKLTKAKTGVPLDELRNGSFESFADPAQSGWEFGNHEQARFNLDSVDVQHGKTALSMKTSGKPVWIRSNPLTLPATGRLSISVWLKTGTPDRQPLLRISAEGISDGSSIYRFGEVGSSASTNRSQSIESQWKRFAVHFDDLPNDLTNLRIGFDLMGEGDVSIDNVAVYDRWFDESDSVAITQLLASAGSQLQNPLLIDDSRRVLENYWIQFLDRHISNEPEASPSETPQNIADIRLTNSSNPNAKIRIFIDSKEGETASILSTTTTQVSTNQEVAVAMIIRSSCSCPCVISTSIIRANSGMPPISLTPIFTRSLCVQTR